MRFIKLFVHMAGVISFALGGVAMTIDYRLYGIVLVLWLAWMAAILLHTPPNCSDYTE